MEQKGWLRSNGKVTQDHEAADIVAEIGYFERHYNLSRPLTTRTWKVIPLDASRRVRGYAVAAEAETRRAAIDRFFLGASRALCHAMTRSE